jgi:hypothetical protein
MCRRSVCGTGASRCATTKHGRYPARDQTGLIPNRTRPITTSPTPSHLFPAGRSPSRRTPKTRGISVPILKSIRPTVSHNTPPSARNGPARSRIPPPRRPLAAGRCLRDSRNHFCPTITARATAAKQRDQNSERYQPHDCAPAPSVKSIIKGQRRQHAPMNPSQGERRLALGGMEQERQFPHACTGQEHAEEDGRQDTHLPAIHAFVLEKHRQGSSDCPVGGDDGTDNGQGPKGHAPVPGGIANGCHRSGKYPHRHAPHKHLCGQPKSLERRGANQESEKRRRQRAQPFCPLGCADACAPTEECGTNGEENTALQHAVTTLSALVSVRGPFSRGLVGGDRSALLLQGRSLGPDRLSPSRAPSRPWSSRRAGCEGEESEAGSPVIQGTEPCA